MAKAKAKNKKTAPRKSAAKPRAVAPKKKLSPGKKSATKKNPFGLQTASEALSLLGHIRQKNPAIRLVDGTVLHGKTVNVFLKEAKRQNPKSKRNIEMGFYAGGSFHPIRSSADYDYSLAGEDKPDRRTKTGKAGATRTKRHKALKSSESVVARARREKAAAAKTSKKKRNFATSYPWEIRFSTASGVVDTAHARTKEDAIRRGKAFASKRADHHAEVVEVATGKATTVKRNPARRNSYLMLVNGGKSSVKRSEAKRKKRNSEGLYEEFHGMDSTRTDVIDLPDSAPAKTERLGERVKVYYQKDGERVSPAGNDNEGKTSSSITLSRDCFLESNSEGNRYFIGAKPGCLPVFSKNGTFGPATRIEYYARKPHLENGDKGLRPYFHVLGEEDGKRPILATDKDGLLIFKGGNYHTNRYGINN